MRTRVAPLAPLAALLLLGATCGETRYDRLDRGGVKIEQLAQGQPAASVGGVVALPGDYVIEGEGLRALVGGMRRGRETRGSILEATLDGAPADDSIVLFTPRLVVGSNGYPIEPTEMFVIERNGKPVLRIPGAVTIGERVIEVVRELTVADAGSAISMATRVSPVDGEPLEDVRVGARIAWGGARPLLPGVGVLEDGVWHDAEWIARRGTAFATVFGYHEPPARVRAYYERHGAAEFLSHTSVISQRSSIPEDGSMSVRGALSLGAPSIAQGLRRLGWIRGRPYPEVLFVLPYAPDGTMIEIETGDGEPLLDTQPDERGLAIVPLTPVSGAAPDRMFIARATAYGHAPSDDVRFDRDRDRRIRLEIPRGGRIRVVVTDAASGERISARLRIRGVGGTPNPELGPEESAGGAVDTVVTVGGEVTVPLSPGTYRVIVTRGIEWSIREERVDVSETFRPDLRVELSHEVDPGAWIGADFHVHAAPSPDSQVTLEDRVASLVAEGVRFAVPTDHNHVTDYAAAIEDLGIAGFGTVTGVEVTTWEPAFGHFNAYPWPFAPNVAMNGAPAYEGTTPSDLFERLHAQGEDVVVQVNHPRMEHGIGYFEVLGLNSRTGSAGDGYSASFDALEVWNGFDLARVEMFERVLDDWLHLLARGHRVVATGNSDSHRVRYQWAGYPRTYVNVPGFAVDDPVAVVRALRAGRAFVSSGPFLSVRVGELGLGDTVTLDGDTLDVHVTVRAPAWMDVGQIDFYAGPEIAATQAILPAAAGTVPAVTRFDGVVTVPVGRAPYLVVLVRGERGLEALLGKNGVPPIAFTNPIWLARPAPRARSGPERVLPSGDAAVTQPDSAR